MNRALLTAAMLLAVCACDETVKENVEASVFLPDGYYREAKVADDMYIPCKYPYACRAAYAITSCKKTGGAWDPGSGYCGSSTACGRCLYPDMTVPDKGITDQAVPDQAAAADAKSGH